MTRLLYTAGIRGDLALLPRLHTFIKALRGDVPEGETGPLLFDLGESCAPDVWPCGVTGGRAAIIVLDAMGYHAIYAGAYLTDAGREKLAANYLNAALVDQTTGFARDGVALGPANAPIRVPLTPAPQPTLRDGVLTLAPERAGQVGEALVEGGALTRAAVHPLLPNTLPDATITGAVEFVEDEARYFEKRQREKAEGGEG